MALNLKCIGEKIGPFIKDYEQKDAILYALGVGAGFSDLHYCYEKDLKVIPSFSIALIFETLAGFAIKAEVNLAGILHGEQELIFHNPIPPEGTLTTNGQISKIYDKGKDKGALVIGESDTFHSNGQKLYTSIFSLFCRLDGGFDGEKTPKTQFKFPKREPDFIVKETPLAEQPLIYRLSGDIFPLHADPEFAKASGFERPIMHGLCTHGFACRALISQLIPGEPDKARRMACRFAGTLYPGIAIKTLIWKTEDEKAVWKVINAETNDIIINNGIFEFGDIPKDEIGFDDRVVTVTGDGDMNPADLFKKMPDVFKKDAAAGMDVVFQFNIKGPKGGDWIVAVKDKECDIKPGEAQNPDCTLTMRDDNFVKLFTGVMTSMQAFSSGKLSLDGDIMKSQLIEKIFDLNL